MDETQESIAPKSMEVETAIQGVLLAYLRGNLSTRSLGISLIGLMLLLEMKRTSSKRSRLRLF